MKKVLIFTAVLCLLLCACGAPARETEPTGTTAAPTAPAEERILGIWQTSIDCSDLCNSYIEATMGTELAHYFDFTGIHLAGTLELKEDGSFTMTISQADVDAYSSEIDRIMHENLYAYLAQVLEEELAGRTMDQYMEETNLTIDHLLIAAGVNMSQMIYDLLDPLRTVPCSGTYYLQEDMLHIAGTVAPFTLAGGLLHIDAPAESDGIAAFPALFPLDFTR